MLSRCIGGDLNMHSIWMRFIIILGSAVMGLALFGTGTASAKDPYIGKTYAEVSAKIAERGGNPVVSTVVGSEVDTDQCIVESWHKSSYVSDDNFDHDKKKYFFALNCAAKLAHAGKPGNSLASEEGRAEKAIEVRAEHYNSKPERCENALASCQKFCEKYAGVCSPQVMALF